MCVKWCRVKNPLSTIKLSFIFACFSPCLSICGRQFPTVTRFLSFVSPFLFTHSSINPHSLSPHVLYTYSKWHFFFFFFSLTCIFLLNHHKSIKIFQARLNVNTWLALLLQNLLFQVIRTPKVICICRFIKQPSVMKKKNMPVGTFLQNDIVLFVARFIAHLKWTVQWLALNSMFNFLQNCSCQCSSILR